MPKQNSNWRVICFFICTLFFYPLSWIRLFIGRLPHWGEFYVFTPGILALAVIILLLSDYKRLGSFFSYSFARFFSILLAVFGVVAFIQLFVLYPNNINYLWSSFYWIVIPLFCAVNRKSIEKILPYFMAFLAVVTVAQSCFYILGGEQCFGLPGNRNWNGSLIVASFPFISYLIYLYCGKINKYWFSWTLILVAVGFVLVLFCESKAALLSLIAAIFFIFILRYWHKVPLAYWIRGGVLLIIAAILLLVLFKEKVNVVLEQDQRISLWNGVIALISDYPLLGCGPELFESVIAPYMPEDYYLGRFVSIRHLHAHNQFLHVGATMGIPVLIAWAVFIISLFVKNLPRALGAGNWDLKLYLFVFVALLVHSLLDVVLLSWPLGCIFLIISGVLLGRAVESSAFELCKTNKILDIVFKVLAACLLLFLSYGMYGNFLSTVHYRNARLMIGRENIRKVFGEVEKSIAARITPQNTILAARISLYDFKKPKACFKYLDLLRSTGFENYEHNNLLRAKALVASGHLVESLKYFDREFDNFPLSCVNLYYYQLILRKVGRKQEAEAVSGHLDRILKLKGFSRKTIPLLLKDPYMDIRFQFFNDRSK
jgi:O-antigen ligase